jgi:hypothetical protein
MRKHQRRRDCALCGSPDGIDTPLPCGRVDCLCLKCGPLVVAFFNAPTNEQALDLSVEMVERVLALWEGQQDND